MTYECSEIERIVWTDGPEAAPQEHIAECDRCRAETRQAADLRAALSGLQTRFADVPAGLEPAIFAAISRSRLDRARDIVTHPKFLRGAAVGAGAAAAAAVGLIVARRRLGPRAEAELVAEAS
jgi:hypothetical protein